MVTGALYMVVRAGLMNDRILAFALERANRALEGEVKAQELLGNPLGSFEIVGIEVIGPDGKEALSISRIKADYSLFGSRRFAPSIFLRATGVRVSAVKAGEQWNWSLLRKKKEARKRIGPIYLPPAEINLELADSSLVISPTPERVISSRVPAARARLFTRLGGVDFEITRFRGAVESPALGINSLDAKGSAESAERGWEIAISSGKLVTASSIVELASGRYATAGKEIEALFSSFEIAPDTLALFWPSHPIGIPVTGSASLGGDLERLAFTVDVASSAGSLEGQGAFQREEKKLTMTGNMSDFSMGEFFARELELKGLSGGYSFEYQGQAPARQDKEVLEALDFPGRYLRARFELDAFTYPGINSFPLVGEFEMIGDKYAGSIVSSEPGADLAVNLSGNVSDPYPILVLAVFNDLNPERVRPGTAEGSLAGSLRIEGQGKSAQTFKGSATLSLSPSTIMNIEVRELEASCSIANGRLDFDMIEAWVEGAEVTGSGWIEPLSSSLPFSFDLAAKLTGREAVSALAGPEYSATLVSTRTNLSGDRDGWKARGSVSASGPEVPFGRASSLKMDFGISGKAAREIKGSIDLKAASMEVPSARYNDLVVPPLDFVASGNLNPGNPRKPRLDLRVNTDSSDLEWDLSADARMSYDFDGKAWSVNLSRLEMTALGQEYALQRAAAVESRAGGLWVGDVELKGKSSMIGVSGQVTGPRLDMTLKAADFMIDPWMEKLLPGQTVQGVVSGAVEIKGPADSPGIDGQINITNARYADTSMDRLETRIEHSSGKTGFDLNGFSELSGEVRAHGSAPLQIGLSPARVAVVRDGPLEVEVVADRISVRVIDRLIPWVEDLAGRISLNARVMGTPREPDWNGKIELSDVKLKVPSWGLSLAGINGTAGIEHGDVTIPRLEARSGQGSATAGGKAKLEGYAISSMDIKLAAKNFRAMNTPDIRAVIDSELRLRGDPDFPRITGNVKFAELYYRPPLILAYQGTSWESEDPTIAVRGEEKPVEQGSPWLDKSDMDIKIDIPDTAQVRSSELNIRLGGKFNLKKPAGGFFLIFGEMEAKEGWVVFQGKPFRVEKGLFIFPAIPVIDPDLDILASYRVPGYTAYIKIGGSLSAPTLEIYSEPPLSQEDVLALILFGKPATELTAGEDEALRSAGTQLVAEFAAAKLGEAFPVDALIVQAGDLPEEQGIGFGKYLNERLYLFYFHNFGEEAAEEFRLRYEVTRSLSVEAGQDQMGQGGVDAYYSHPY